MICDFNDEPFDDSLVRHALSTRQAARVERGRNVVPFGGMGRPVNVNGHSDHSPIACTDTELDRTQH